MLAPQVETCSYNYRPFVSGLILLAFIEQSGYKPSGPVLETWMDDPAQTKPEDCRTLIIIPVDKKTP
jgi:hypothetical protein